MKYVVAVSGGVDSIVMLDMLVNNRIQQLNVALDDIIVAHFEHGIRGVESKNDAKFVEKLSQKYRLKFEIAHGNLSKDSSEDTARNARYNFLNEVAKKYAASIVTAHHKDDLIETIVLNLKRGTGWRGIAVFGNDTIIRPLLDNTKPELYEYAIKWGLEWVEDSTNATSMYLRNRIRRKLLTLDEAVKNDLIELYRQQTDLRIAINIETTKNVKVRSRYFYQMIDHSTACEILRHVTHARLTRPQLERLWTAIKTAKQNTTIECGNGVYAEFLQREFIVKTPETVL